MRSEQHLGAKPFVCISSTSMQDSRNFFLASQLNRDACEARAKCESRAAKECKKIIRKIICLSFTAGSFGIKRRASRIASFIEQQQMDLIALHDEF